MYILIGITAWIVLFFAALVLFLFSWSQFTINILFKISSTPTPFMKSLVDNKFFSFWNTNVYSSNTPVFNFFYGNFNDSVNLNAFQLYIFPILSLIVFGIIIFYCVDEFSRIKKHQVISRIFFKPILIILIVFNIMLGKYLTFFIALTLLIGACGLELLFLDRNLVNNLVEEKELVNIKKDKDKFSKLTNQNLSNKIKRKLKTGSGFSEKKNLKKDQNESSKGESNKSDKNETVKRLENNFLDKKPIEVNQNLAIRENAVPNMDEFKNTILKNIFEARLNDIENRVNEILSLLKQSEDRNAKRVLERELSTLKMEGSRINLIKRKPIDAKQIEKNWLKTKTNQNLLNIYNSELEKATIQKNLSIPSILPEVKEKTPVKVFIPTKNNLSSKNKNVSFHKNQIFIEFERKYLGIKFDFKKQKKFFYLKLKGLKLKNMKFKNKSN